MVRQSDPDQMISVGSQCRRTKAAKKSALSPISTRFSGSAFSVPSELVTQQGSPRSSKVRKLVLVVDMNEFVGSVELVEVDPQAGYLDHHLAPVAARGLDRAGEHAVAHRVEVLEREILQLQVERVEAQPVGDRRVDVERLARDALAVQRRHRIERAHVVQPVGELDQDDAHVARHREQHLAEALGLQLLARVELDLVELRHAVDHVGDRPAERRLDLGLGDGGVLHHVVQQRGGEPLRVDAPLRQDARDRERMRDVRLARLAVLAAVGGLGELERALDELDVRRRQVVAQVLG